MKNTIILILIKRNKYNYPLEVYKIEIKVSYAKNKLRIKTKVSYAKIS